MFSDCHRPFVVCSLRVVLALMLAAAAWASNPDGADFQRWLGAAAPTQFERTDFGFCTLIQTRAPEASRYLGAFGHWWNLPRRLFD
jgi:hypothetical protein